MTLNIYGIVALSSVSNDINVIASRYDGKRTMHYCLLYFLISWLTLGIGVFVWYHKISGRIGEELHRRRIRYTFNSNTFWLWDILGAFIVIGPFVYMHKLFTAMNLLSEHYNVNG